MSVHYNSCRDRCCPMCQEFPKEKWVDARREDILDAPYFHVVFTVPEELNPIIYSNQKFLYSKRQVFLRIFKSSDFPYNCS